MHTLHDHLQPSPPPPASTISSFYPCSLCSTSVGSYLFMAHLSAILLQYSLPRSLHISLAPPPWDLPQRLLLKLVFTNFFPPLALPLSLPCSIFLHSTYHPLTQCIFSLFMLLNVYPLQLDCNSKRVGIIACFGHCCVPEPIYNLVHVVGAQQIIV